MLQEFQNSNGVAPGKRYALVARHDLLGGRQSRSHDKSRKVKPLVGSGGGEDALLFARRAQFDSVVARFWTYWHSLSALHHLG